jgi:hypothetical protein
MKKKLIVVFAVITVMTLAIAAFAYSRTTTVTETPVIAQSGDHHDSCPMKMKDASGKEVAMDCDKCDHCKGDSCPMKKGDGSQKPMSDTAAGTAQGDAKSCDCPYCHKHHENKDG